MIQYLSAVIVRLADSSPTPLKHAVIRGVRSFERPKRWAEGRTVGTELLLMGTLSDVITPKKAAGRDCDRAAIPVRERTLRIMHQG